MLLLVCSFVVFLCRNMEYRVGCLADLISGVKSASTTSSKIVLQPVNNVRDAVGKKRKKTQGKRKSSAVDFVPVVGPAENVRSLLNSQSGEAKLPETRGQKSTKKNVRHRPAVSETPVDFVPIVGPAENVRSLLNLQSGEPKLPETQGLKLTKKKDRHRPGISKTPGEFGSNFSSTTNLFEKPKEPRDEAAEARTVFIKNLPINIKASKVKKIFERIGEVESIRYRCAPREDVRVPKKVAFIKRKFHPDRTTICAFVRFKSEDDAQKALSEANGMELEGHHIMVDKALKDNSHDQRKAVFVGNVPFGAEEEDMWALFSKCGAIKDIRIVRDGETGVGKGFAYVNFESSDGVELALSLDGELLKDRNIRVKRAVNRPKNKIAFDKGQNSFQQQKSNEQKQKKFKGNKAKGIVFVNKLGPGGLKFENIQNKKKWKKKEKGAFGNKEKDVEKLPYQGMKGEGKREKKKKMNKEERRKKILAKKFGYA